MKHLAVLAVVAASQGADAAAQELPSARHLVIQGAEHSDDLLISSPLIAQGIGEFLRGRPLTHPVVAVPFSFTMPRGPGSG